MLTTDHMMKIWVKMTRIYGHKWVSNYGDADDGTWFTALKNIPTEMIQRGLQSCLARADIWPPSLPEFCRLCLNIPDVETVKHRITNNKGSDPISKAIAAKIGSWNLRHLSERDVRARIGAMYDDVYTEETNQLLLAGPEMDKLGHAE